MKRFIDEFEVIGNRRINQEYVILTLKHPGKLPDMLPGQFAEVKANNAPDSFLRRPISIHDIDMANNLIKLLIREVGEGTKSIGQTQVGNHLSLVYPLGNGFSMPASKEAKLLLVGGGCGIAPMLFLGRVLKSNGYKPEFLFGARNASGLLELDEFNLLGKVYTTTEDGSHGTKGYVIHSPVMRTLNPDIDLIYTCGPDAMMRVVAKYAREHGILCEVSLENTMACGIGVCLCCVTDTVDGHQCVCTEGPIFDSKKLKW